jgi:ectoine hydroxylase-related dioxygenase (phytanoyl-CoA dioxygenase family)
VTWLAEVLESLRHVGYAVVDAVLPPPFLDATRRAMYRVQQRIVEAVGRDRLERAGEVGVLRLMFLYDEHFFRFLEIDEMLAVVDATVSPTAVLHLQNGFVLPSSQPGRTPDVFQTRFHMDFPRVLNGYLASINVLFAIDEFAPDTGATLVVPATHQRTERPSNEYLQRHALPVVCRAGGMVVFDSTLWHAAGPNTSGRDRLAINHQFTRSYLKQQIDYARALPPAVVLAQKPRTQQLLGWYTRVPTSLDEYYRPEEARLYRKHQG